VKSPSLGPRFRRFELVLAVLSAVALGAAVAEWRGWIGDEKPFRPLQSIFLLSYFTLLAASWVTRSRSERLANALEFGAAAAFVLSAANLMAG
jgi:hypothetical protein